MLTSGLEFRKTAGAVFVVLLLNLQLCVVASAEQMVSRSEQVTTIRVNIAHSQLVTLLVNLPPVLANVANSMANSGDKASCIRQDSITFICSKADVKVLVKEEHNGQSEFKYRLKFDDGKGQADEIHLSMLVTGDASDVSQITFVLSGSNSKHSSSGLFKSVVPIWDVLNQNAEVALNLLILANEAAKAQTNTILLSDQVETYKSELGESRGIMGTQFRQNYTLGFVFLTALFFGIGGFAVGTWRQRDSASGR